MAMKRNPLVAVDKRVVLGETEPIGRRKLRQASTLVVPFV